MSRGNVTVLGAAVAAVCSADSSLGCCASTLGSVGHVRHWSDHDVQLGPFGSKRVQTIKFGYAGLRSPELFQVFLVRCLAISPPEVVN